MFTDNCTNYSINYIKTLANISSIIQFIQDICWFKLCILPASGYSTNIFLQLWISKLTPWLMEPGSSMPHYKDSPVIPILSQIDQISHIDTNLFKIHSNIDLPSTPRPP